jgi:hypothetical protein
MACFFNTLLIALWSADNLFLHLNRVSPIMLWPCTGHAAHVSIWPIIARSGNNLTTRLKHVVPFYPVPFLTRFRAAAVVHISLEYGKQSLKIVLGCKREFLIQLGPRQCSVFPFNFSFIIKFSYPAFRVEQDDTVLVPKHGGLQQQRYQQVPFYLEPLTWLVWIVFFKAPERDVITL